MRMIALIGLLVACLILGTTVAVFVLLPGGMLIPGLVILAGCVSVLVGLVVVLARAHRRTEVSKHPLDPH